MNIETNSPPDISAMIPADKKEDILKLAAVGLTATQIAAAAGNIDAIKTLRGIQRENRFNEFIYYMDDDEFTG